jgi:hypothetical protein
MADTLFMQDIMNTPKALRDTLAGIGDGADALAAQFLAAGGRRLVTLGNGTSYFAAAASICTIPWCRPPAPWRWLPRPGISAFIRFPYRQQTASWGCQHRES